MLLEAVSGWVSMLMITERCKFVLDSRMHTSMDDSFSMTVRAKLSSVAVISGRNDFNEQCKSQGIKLT